MAAFTSIALGASAAAGIAGTIAQVNAAKQNARKQAAALRQQEISAREAAKKQTTRDDTGARVRLGTDDPNSMRKGSNRVQGSRSGAVSGAVGGVSASKRLGV